MRGKQVLMESLIAHGVEHVFGNPGTTESPILDALLDYPQLRYIVALHEGVALGAASYFAQTSGRLHFLHLLGALVGGAGLPLGLLRPTEPEVDRAQLLGHQPAWGEALNWTGTEPTPKSLRRG